MSSTAPTRAHLRLLEAAAPVTPPAAVDPSLLAHGSEPLSDADLLASLPDDPSALVWPSQVWNEHLARCRWSRRRCPHTGEVVLPDWWLALMRGRPPVHPLHRDPAVAIEIAMRRINGFTGGPLVSPEGAAFARDVVRDALPCAPQPLSKDWVSFALSTSAGLGTWVHRQGEPLIREHVFAERTRRRWLHGRGGATHLSRRTRDVYESRLDKMATILLASPRRPKSTDTPPNPRGEPLMPLTRQQEADLWVWSAGLRPATVRKRVQAILACCLGCGAHRRDLSPIRAEDITRDQYAVRLSLPELAPSGRQKEAVPPRTVICRAEWEDRLWSLAQACPRGHYLIAPWRDTEPSLHSMDATVRNAINDLASPPPVNFSAEVLRNTWLVRHLSEGTPLPVLLARAGLVTLVHVEKLLVHCDPAPEPLAITLMRGHRAAPVEAGEWS